MFKRVLGAKVFLEKRHGSHEGLRRPCSLLRRPPSTLKDPFIVPPIKFHTFTSNRQPTVSGYQLRQKPHKDRKQLPAMSFPLRCAVTEN